MRLPIAVLALALLAAPAAVAQDAPTGAGITIAVVDSGIDSSHSEVAGRVSRVSFWSPGLPAGLPADLPLAEDPSGQGTAVASLAAGSTLGLAPHASLLDLQVSAQYTNGVADPAVEAAAIQALDYLLQDPARAQIVVLSFAQNGLSPQGAATIAGQANALWREGVIVVVPTSAQVNPVSSAPSVLTVAGSEQCPAPFASANLKPDVVAQSQGLRAAAPSAPGQPGTTATVSGTAYAAAQAAGALALVRSGFPQLPADAAMAFLRDSAADLGDPGPDRCSGFGLVDSASALQWAGTWKDPLESRGARSAPLPALVLLAPLAAAALRRRI